MRSRSRFSLLLALLGLGAAGCGGGGGEKLSADPVAAVQAREAAMRAALDQRDLVTFVGFYSDRFKDHEGMTKPEFRQMLFVSEEQEEVDYSPLERVDIQYVVSSNRRRVQVYYVVRLRYTYEDPETGETGEYTYPESGQVDWVNEGGVWRIIYEREAGMATVLGVRRGR
jgi:hypothetical protein